MRGGKVHRPAQVPEKVLPRARVRFAVVFVVTGQLDEPHPDRFGQQHRPLENFHAAPGRFGVLATQRVSAVGAQAHRRHRAAGAGGALHEAQPLLFAPVQPGELLIRLIDAEFEAVVTGLARGRQLFGEGQAPGHRFLVEPQRVSVHHRHPQTGSSACATLR